MLKIYNYKFESNLLVDTIHNIDKYILLIGCSPLWLLAYGYDLEPHDLHVTYL